MENEIKKLIGKIFDTDVLNISEDKIIPDNIEKWDSMGHLNLITSLEEDFSIEFEPEEIIEMLNGFKEIVKIVNQKIN